MKFKMICIHDNPEGGVDVMVDGLIGLSLSHDEALATVAALFFGSPAEVPRYIKTMSAEKQWRDRLGERAPMEQNP